MCAMPTLLWFRRDLRLHDLPALLDAADGSGVLACFVLDPRLEGPSGPRRMRMASPVRGNPVLPSV